jgi:prolyl oligopeptidase
MMTGKKPPPARVEVVRETHFGQTIEDPYRWMEAYESDELQSWVREQAAYAREHLEALPERQAFLSRINELTRAAPVLAGFSPAGKKMFYVRRDPSDRLPKLCVREVPAGEERVLFDPNATAGEVHIALDWFKPSTNGQRVAYGSSPGGSENSVLRVMEVESGQTLDLEIPRTFYGMVTWLDDETFLYNRSPDITPDTPPTDYYCNSRILLRRADGKPEDDPVIFGRGGNPEVEFADIDIPNVKVSDSSEWALGVVMHGDAREKSIYITRREQLSQPDRLRWQAVAEMEDAIETAVLHGEQVYLLTHREAPRYKVVATSASQPDMASAVLIVPESEMVIDDIKVAGDTLLVKGMEFGQARLQTVDLRSGHTRTVEMPFDGSITGWSASAEEGAVYLLMMGWTESLRLFRYDLSTGEMRRMGWIPDSPVDFSEVEVKLVEAPAYDGTPIPVTILHRQGLALDGDNPALLRGYGSYGLTFKPTFDPALLAWLERGGVYAVAHLRGGGFLGRAWHEAGRLLNKENTINDFLACAEYLIAQNYTRAARLAGQGTSAGGIPSGGALVRRPDLFTVMVIRVAVTNALRMETTENGPPNVMEFGSFKNEDGFKGLMLMDAYHRVQDGTRYPAVLLTTGLNDPRVVVWMATKMAARLQAATASDQPILLRVEEQGGHGMGSTLDQLNAERAEIYAFLWEQFRLSGDISAAKK